jgi:hypothetical protein
MNTNAGKCPACGALLAGVGSLCYATIEDYTADQDKRGPQMPQRLQGGKHVPIAVCVLCGKPKR